MPVISDALTAMDILHAHLETVFHADPAFNSYGGVAVAKRRNQPQPDEIVTVPTVFLWLGDDVPAGDTWGREYRRATVEAEVKTSGVSGAEIGDANPDASQVLVSRKLHTVIIEDYAALRHVGLQGISVTGPREATESRRDGETVHRNRHGVEFFYNTQ